MVQSALRRRQQKSGVDGLILPDVPFEEKEEFAIPFKEHGLDLISLIATTSHERIAMIAKEAEGFGISEPKQAKKMAAQSDEVIVGSAIVKLCEKYGADCVPHISTFVKEMRTQSGRKDMRRKWQDM